MKRWIIVAFLVAVSTIAKAETSAEPTLRSGNLLADINARGAQVVVAALRANNNQWDQVMRNISRGNGQWLNVAAALRPGTDAGSSETLDQAVFLALEHEPVRVLQLLKHGIFETATVCSSNIATDYPDAQSREFIRERIVVLQGVPDPNTLVARDRCLAGLRAALAEFDKPMDRMKPP